jgi:hypothetical protein
VSDATALRAGIREVAATAAADPLGLPPVLFAASLGPGPLRFGAAQAAIRTAAANAARADEAGISAFYNLAVALCCSKLFQ